MKKRILFIIILGSLLPLRINALNASIHLNCDKTTLSPNESITCTITGSTTEEVSTVSAKIKVGNYLTLSNIKTSSIWQGNGEGGSIDLYTDTNKTGTFAIATFTITASNVDANTEVFIQSVYYSDASFQQFNIPSVKKNITISIPSVEVPEDNNNNNNNNSSNSGGTNNPSKPSSGGSNNSQNTNPKSNDSSLKSISLNIDNFYFDKNQKEYQLEVENQIENITIQAEANDEKASVTLPTDLSLKVGNNLFEIKVTAEDGTTSVYKININRLEKVLSNNCYLKSLQLKQYELDFDKEITSYTIESIKASTLDLTVETEDSNATYQIYGNHNLSDDDVVIIKVTAQDNTYKEYILYIKEVKESHKISVWIVGLIVLFILLSIFFNVLEVMKKIKMKQTNEKDNHFS